MQKKLEQLLVSDPINKFNSTRIKQLTYKQHWNTICSAWKNNTILILVLIIIKYISFIVNKSKVQLILNNRVIFLHNCLLTDSACWSMSFSPDIFYSITLLYPNPYSASAISKKGRPPGYIHAETPLQTVNAIYSRALMCIS